jgi:hypothetical protein
LFPFHSPGAMEAGSCGVERRPPVQGRSELQAHNATVLQCLAVGVPMFQEQAMRVIECGNSHAAPPDCSDGAELSPDLTDTQRCIFRSRSRRPHGTC